MNTYLRTGRGIYWRLYQKYQGLGVIAEAQHLCMSMRGVEKETATMTTSCMEGLFRDSVSVRLEFLALVNR